MTAGSDGAGRGNLAVAEQVIISAGNILAAAGFDRDEIASFFRQAADQLAAGKVSGESDALRVSQSTMAGFDRLKAAVTSSTPVRELAKLELKAASLDPPGQGRAALKESFDLAMKMVPQIADAQDWLRRAAREAGLPVFANRRDLPKRAPGEGEECDAIFFEDFESAYAQSLGVIRSVFIALAEEGDEEAFAFLLEGLLENSVVVSFEIKEAMENAASTLAMMPKPSDDP